MPQAMLATTPNSMVLTRSTTRPAMTPLTVEPLPRPGSSTWAEGGLNRSSSDMLHRGVADRADCGASRSGRARLVVDAARDDEHLLVDAHMPRQTFTGALVGKEPARLVLPQHRVV